MTLGTLAAVMVGGFIIGMAGLAICGSGGLVVEAGRFPTHHRVAGRALSSKVIGRLIIDMARGAVVHICHSVIEAHILPGEGIMTGGAIPLVMIGWAIGGMAGNTLVGSACKLPARVAAFTGKRAVRANQGKESVLCSRAAWWETDRQRIEER